jgi:hypothetical protein
MTDDEIVGLDSFAETVTLSDAWRLLVEQFEQQVFQHFMSTAPRETRTPAIAGTLVRLFESLSCSRQDSRNNRSRARTNKA